MYVCICLFVYVILLISSDRELYLSHSFVSHLRVQTFWWGDFFGSTSSSETTLALQETVVELFQLKNKKKKN